MTSKFVYSNQRIFELLLVNSIFITSILVSIILYKNDNASTLSVFFLVILSIFLSTLSSKMYIYGEKSELLYLAPFMVVLFGFQLYLSKFNENFSLFYLISILVWAKIAIFPMFNSGKEDSQNQGEQSSRPRSTNIK